MLTGNTNPLTWVVALVFTLLVAESLDACQCGRKFTPAEGLTNATAVFEGRLIATQIVFAQERGWLGPVPEYEFLVSRMWKGKPSRTVFIRAEYHNCTRLFKDGEPYLVYAWPHENVPTTLSSSICDPTKRLSEAVTDLAVLGPAKAIYRHALGSSPRSRASRVRAYAVGGVAAYANLIRHPTDDYAWRAIGIHPLILLALGLTTLIAGVAFRMRHRRIGTVLIWLVPPTLAAALFAAGEMMFRNSWFSQYLE